ncbi:MAG TPA: ABC transporter substrate binding protein, partial [Dongiaceae bacterium]
KATVVGIGFDAVSREQRDSAAEAARQLRLEPRPIEVRAAAGYADTFAAMDDARGQPLVLMASPIFLRDREPVAQVLLARKIPSIAAFRENAEAGSLISYGFDLVGLFHDIAGYVDRIARGGKPAEMPIEQSSRYHLAVNMRTAAALGLALPDTFVARADQVIE